MPSCRKRGRGLRYGVRRATVWGRGSPQAHVSPRRGPLWRAVRQATAPPMALDGRRGAYGAGLEGGGGETRTVPAASAARCVHAGAVVALDAAPPPPPRRVRTGDCSSEFCWRRVRGSQSPCTNGDRGSPLIAQSRVMRCASAHDDPAGPGLLNRLGLLAKINCSILFCFS